MYKFSDTEFGWYLNDIIEDKNLPPRKEITSTNITKPLLNQLKKEDAFMESIDIVEPEKPKLIKHIEVNISTAPVLSVVNCKMDIEVPPVRASESKLTREFKNINSTHPPKEELTDLILPCNLEAKSLMSVISFAKYKSTEKQETASELFKTINFKTTKSKHLIKGRDSAIHEKILKDLERYHASTTDMLSLMMELLLADVGCNLEDIVDVKEQHSDNSDTSSEPSDLGSSIQTSYYSKDWSSLNSNYSDILSSIGLSEEEKNIQYVCDETMDIKLQVEEIRKSFQEEDHRVDRLLKETRRLNEEMKEAQYLDDILQLLEGNIEKVKLIKLPFKQFYKDESEGAEFNLII